MKLLLTSGGVTNPSIAGALFDLVGKKPEETTLAFIPTAANVEKGDKWWLIRDLIDLKNLRFQSIDIIDISAIERRLWQPRLEGADILFFEGGDTFHLMEHLNKSGLADVLPELLARRVCVGVSAGSMIACGALLLKDSQMLYDESFNRTNDMKGLGFVDFYIVPHLNSAHFPKITEENVRRFVETNQDGTRGTIYVLDDNSALKVVDGTVEVISEGKWFAMNG